MASSVAFAVLCAMLAAIGRIPAIEAIWAAAAVAVVFVPTAYLAPVGWRRRAAEAVLVLPAWAVVMAADPVQRRMLAPPLLVAACCAAVAAAWPRIPSRRRTTVLVLLALSARSATGAAFAGWEWWRVVLAFIAGGLATWAAVRVGGRELGVAAALLTAVLPLHEAPWVSGGLAVVSVIAGALGKVDRKGIRGGSLLPGAVGLAVVGLAAAPWGGIATSRAFPGMDIWVLVLVAAALVLLRPPAGLAGAVWVTVILVLAAPQAPTPDRRGFVLGGELADVDMPVGTGAPYVLDIGLDGAADIAPGTAVAWFRVGDRTHRLLYPEHAVFRNGDGAAATGRVWRPQGSGARAGWRAAVRTTFEVPAGVVPRLTRHPDLAGGIVVALETEGPALPTPPRRRALGWWVVATAAAVALLQLFSGTWRTTLAAVPWAVLAGGALLARVWVEPLRLLGERLAPDLALAALLAAWLPAAAVWLRRRRVAAAVAALLLPLAAATPQLTPPLHGDEPFHLAAMASMLDDRDLEMANNIDLEGHPQEASFQQDGNLLHSPVLGVLLLPGFAAAGRTGALVLLALAGSAAASLLFRRARRLGVPEARLRFAMIVVAATYPLATFATQIWVEVVGVLAVSAILVAAADGRGGRWAAVAWALVATAVKTRLGLLVFPPAAAAWWGSRRRRRTGLMVLVVAAVIAAAVGWLTMGHPFGIYRRLGDLVPSDPALAVRVLGGLVFDPAGGIVFSAPLWLVAAAGAAALWRRGGPGERMLLAGCAATVVALLPSIEWYGGGSPPARYLVPMLPAFVLAGGFLLREPRRWRRAAEILLAPAVAVWWVLVTRPHLAVNPGDGGWWATDALARSYLVDTAWLAPSFLVPRTATWVVPLIVALSAAVVVVLARWRPALAGRLAAAGAALWLLGAAGVVAAIELRTDRAVEAEAPQVRRHGGRPYPREGTASRFTRRRGWRLADGEGVTVPLKLPADAEVVLECFPLGKARRGARLEIRWDAGEPRAVRLEGEPTDGRVVVPGVPGAGRHRLGVTVRSRPNGAVVLDRFVVEGGG